NQLVEEVGGLFEISSPQTLLDRNPFIRETPAEINRIRRSCAQRLDRPSSPLLNESIDRLGMMEITSRLLGCFERPTRNWKPPKIRFRNQALKRALIQIFEDPGDQPLSVAELSKRAGASIRTLRYAFNETFGVSPKDYLQAYRLNQVRSRLKNSNPGTVRVSDVANDYAFWHLGQFAKDYRKLFAELPSETLAKKPGKPAFEQKPA
ncbi:MAG: helix-turn-helix domain-containing protein, partial [Verrucomicrobiales bacterium]